VPRIFSPLRIHSPRPGSNPRILGIVASTFPLDGDMISVAQVIQRRVLGLERMWKVVAPGIYLQELMQVKMNPCWEADLRMEI
jgi:hypothetical protein